MHFIVSHEMMLWEKVLRLKDHKRLGLEDDLYTPPVQGRTISEKNPREGFVKISRHTGAETFFSPLSKMKGCSQSQQTELHGPLLFNACSEKQTCH